MLSSLVIIAIYFLKETWALSSSSRVISGFADGNKLSGKQILKTDILNLARRINRGLNETKEERQNMLEMFESLEKQAPMKENLMSPFLQAIWKLEYSTNDIIIGRKGFTKVGDILQYVDVKNLKSQNRETIDFFGLKIPRVFTAKLTPLSPSEVKS